MTSDTNRHSVDVMSVLDRVTDLLAQAGFRDDSSIRHQLAIAKSIIRERLSHGPLSMPSTDEIKLAAGEMTAQELRTVKAVLGWFIRRCSAPHGPNSTESKDAERYRWIRDMAARTPFGGSFNDYENAILQGSDLDAFVDERLPHATNSKQSEEA